MRKRAVLLARTTLSAAASDEHATRASTAVLPMVAAALGNLSAAGVRQPLLSTTCPERRCTHQHQHAQPSAACALQHSRWRSLQPQRGFAAGPKRNKRVDAALERRKRQQALADSQQAAAPVADLSVEGENRIVASHEAASEPEIASVVGHSGAHSILCMSANAEALSVPCTAFCALRGVPPPGATCH